MPKRVLGDIGQRLAAKSSIDANGCWVWQGTLHPEGYGYIWTDGRKTTTHRASYEFFIGPIPDGLQLDHLCRNRACWNPDHLEPVTVRVNLLRGNGWGGRNARKTHCLRGHPLTPDNLSSSPPNGRPGGRSCLTCHRERERERRRRLRSAAA